METSESAKIGVAWIGRGNLALARSAAAYAFVNGGPGALSPFFGLWLKTQGFGAGQIGLILAAPLLGRMALAPCLGAWANQYRRLRAPLILLCVATAAAAAAPMIGHGFWLVLAAWFVACVSVGFCGPMLDVATLRAATRSGFAFPTARSASSLATIAGGVGLGALFAAHGPATLPVWSLIGSILAAIFIALFVTSRPRREMLPRDAERGSAERGSAENGISAGGASPALLVMLLGAAGMIQLSHGLNSMAMLNWRAQGINAGWCGLLWQTGTAADVALLWVLGRYPIAPSRLLVLGGVGAVVRWTLFALSPPLPVLFVLQPLHALSFTATYVAAVQLIDQLVADRHGVFAQALYWGLTTGLCTGAGVAGAGFLYQRAGANGYWAMCALALVGLAVALRLNRRLVGPRAFEFQMDLFETDQKALSLDVRARRAARPASTPA